MTRSAHYLLSTTVYNNISPLYAQHEQCARVTMHCSELRRPERYFLGEYLIFYPVA